jgi:large subunit ribosomal protein L25
MAEQLKVALREATGKHPNRRLRKAGQVPAVLYGHNQENVCVSVAAEDLEAAVRRGSRLVDLTGGLSESALIRELQWDTWGVHVLHVDFTRVSADENVEVEISVELRGEAPGVKEGGVVEQLVHRVAIECRAASVPDKLEISVNDLQLGGSITVAQLEVPAGGRVLRDAETVVVHCVEPTLEPEEEEVVEAAEGEPVVIGEKKPEDEQAEGD